MASLEDMRKLMAEQTDTLVRKRELDRAEDNKRREEERAEDIDKISNIVEHKVHNQISVAIDPIIKRQDDLEAKSVEQYDTMSKQIAAIQESLANPKPNSNSGSSVPLAPTIPSVLYRPPMVRTGATQKPGSEQTPTTPQQSADHVLFPMIQKAERTVGFQPLYKSDVEEMC